MAENDKCVKRVVASNEFNAVHANHHEWRFLRRYGVLEGSVYKEEGSVYYCVFCLEYKKVKDGTPT